MGAAESTQHMDAKFFGFRVYKLAEGGPLFNSGVRELEDFIIPPEEVYANRTPFYEYIRMNEGKTISLNVFSLSKRYFYPLSITPNNEWCLSKDQGYLGASVRYENWSTAYKSLLRVLKVLDNSFAQRKLELVANDDFIIALRPEGEDISTLNRDNLDPLTMFTNIINLYKGKYVEFYIYNQKRGARSKRVQLDEDVLGCDVAYGKLHEFPRIENSKEEKPLGNKNKEENLHKIVELENEDEIGKLEIADKIDNIDAVEEKINFKNISSEVDIKKDIDDDVEITNLPIVEKNEEKLN